MAIFVLTTGALIVARSVSLTRHNVGISREEFEATNLAREGLELIYALRDSERGELQAAGDYSKGPWEKICENAEYTIEPPSGGDGLPAIGNVSDKVLKRNSEGVWQHYDGEETPYSRVIKVDCVNAGVGDADYNPFLKQYYVDVTSEVSWRSRDMDRIVDVKTRLFDWRTEEAQAPEPPEEDDADEELIP